MTDTLTLGKNSKTVLIVEAHPDDAAFFAGGTIAKLAQEGHHLINLCSTYGEKGILDPDMTLEAMIELEKKESQRAAKILGIAEVLYLGIPDGELTAGLDLRRQYIEVLRRVRPDMVLSFDPHSPYDPHPDHVAAGRTIYEACYLSHFHLYYPEQLEAGLQPHYISKLYGWNSPTPNTYIDITETLEIKIKAAEQYESQITMLIEETRNRLKIAGKDVPILRELNWRDLSRLWITSSAQTMGKQANYQYAEAFNVISLGLVDAISESMNLPKKSNQD